MAIDKETRGFIFGFVTSIATGITTFYITQKYIAEKVAAKAIAKYKQEVEQGTLKTQGTIENWKPLSNEELQYIKLANRVDIANRDDSYGYIQQ